MSRTATTRTQEPALRLAPATIDAIASNPRVDKDAVRSFLSGLETSAGSAWEQAANRRLDFDAAINRWSPYTVKAIFDGIYALRSLQINSWRGVHSAA